MPLPKIKTPTYELVLPSTGKKIRYRPFLVKEEKILIIALESEDIKQITNAIKDVISGCILTRGVKVDHLSTFDMEYLFLNIRGKSVGEEVEVLVTCPDDNKTKVAVNIPLDDIQIVKDSKHTKDIILDDNLKMRMKYPSLSQFINSNFNPNEVGLKESFDLITSCIDQVYNEEESWSASDCSKKELTEFIEQLNSKQFKEVEYFFDSMPKLSYTVEVLNPKTNVKNKIILEGLSDFFE
tara:strand:+ start:3795 stop:4511 length:717 start_codon:yes stop_codon:yes gene_type:complete